LVGDLAGMLSKLEPPFMKKIKLSRCEILESFKTPNKIQCLASAGRGEIDNLSYIACVLGRQPQGSEPEPELRR
jgi:hypothetical protein